MLPFLTERRVRQRRTIAEAQGYALVSSFCFDKDRQYCLFFEDTFVFRFDDRSLVDHIWWIELSKVKSLIGREWLLLQSLLWQFLSN